MEYKKSLVNGDFYSKLRITIADVILFMLAISINSSCDMSSDDPALDHVVVASEQGRFFGWPANNELWSFEDGGEILVGFTNGPWEDRSEHNIGEHYSASLARSIDGGKHGILSTLTTL